MEISAHNIMKPTIMLFHFIIIYFYHYSFQPEGLRLRIIGRLKTLTKLGGIVVSDEETAAAHRMAAGSRISQVSLLMHSRTDTEPLRTLSLQTHAHTLTQYSNRKPDRAVDLDNNWYLKVRYH